MESFTLTSDVTSFEGVMKPFTVTSDEVSAIAERYAKNQCAYHNFAHVADLCAVWRRVFGPLYADVLLAILFHDVVYDPMAKDNEERSVEFMREFFAGKAPSELLDRVEEMILATKSHDHADEYVQCFLDVDMSVLGRPWEGFLTYCEQIRAEYANVPDDLFNVGRRKFFESLLIRPSIFLTDLFRGEFEEQARHNVSRYLRDFLPAPV